MKTNHKLQFRKDTFLFMFNNGKYSTDAHSTLQAINQIVFTRFGKATTFNHDRDVFKESLTLDSKWFLSKGELCDNIHNNKIWNETYSEYLESKKEYFNDVE